MADISIRQAVRADAKAIAEFGARSWFAGIAPHVSTARSARDMQALFLDFAHEFVDQITLGVLNGRPVGFVATEHGKNFISDLWVDPDHFGKGIGSQLLLAQEAIVRARGHERAIISALTANGPALRLYRSRGYVDVETWDSLDTVLREVLRKTRLEKSLIDADSASQSSTAK